MLPDCFNESLQISGVQLDAAESSWQLAPRCFEICSLLALVAGHEPSVTKASSLS
jgi:hypothetical protein